MWGGSTEPADWLLCNGQAVSRATYVTLFAAIGTAYGAGDGSTTFNVPNMSQRFPLGKAAAGTGAVLGASGGQIDHAHVTPAHGHGAGTLAVASHAHDAGSLAVASHTHSAGSFAVASHTHAAGTFATNSTGNHDHYVNQHTHPVSLSGTTDGGVKGPQRATSAQSPYMDVNDPGHTHGVSLSGTSGNSSSSTRTDINGAHSHTLTGATAAATPGVSGTSGAAAPAVAGSTGATAPAVSGAVAADPGMTTDAKNPPYLTVNFLIRAN